MQKKKNLKNLVISDPQLTQKIHFSEFEATTVTKCTELRNFKLQSQ